MRPLFRQTLRVLLLALLVVAASVGAATARQVISLNADWRFRYEPGIALEAVVEPGFVDTDWQQVTVPHTWNAEDGQSTSESYARGHGVYRKIFKVPDHSGGQRVPSAIHLRQKRPGQNVRTVAG